MVTQGLSIKHPQLQKWEPQNKRSLTQTNSSHTRADWWRSENVVSFNVAIGDSTPLAATWLNFGHIPVWTKAAQFLFQIFEVLDGLWRPTDSVLMLS